MPNNSINSIKSMKSKIYSLLKYLDKDAITLKLENAINKLREQDYYTASCIINQISINDTIIHYCVNRNFSNVLEVFINIKIDNRYIFDPHSKNTHGFPALFNGLHKSSRKNVLLTLLKHPLIQNNITEIRSSNGQTFLNHLVKSEERDNKEVYNLEIWDQALKHLPKIKEALNQLTVEGETLLELACSLGKFELAKRFIEAGADINEGNTKGKPLINHLKKMIFSSTEKRQELKSFIQWLNDYSNSKVFANEITQNDQNVKILELQTKIMQQNQEIVCLKNELTGNKKRKRGDSPSSIFFTKYPEIDLNASLEDNLLNNFGNG